MADQEDTIEQLEDAYRRWAKSGPDGADPAVLFAALMNLWKRSLVLHRRDVRPSASRKRAWLALSFAAPVTRKHLRALNVGIWAAGFAAEARWDEETDKILVRADEDEGAAELLEQVGDWFANVGWRVKATPGGAA